MARRLALILSLCLLVLLSSTSSIPVQAQSYFFSVPTLKMQVYVQSDASIRIVYDITFDNMGDPIDVVDIGLPNRDYDISNMTASIDGFPLSDIRKSEYIDIGVEVHLDDHAIDSGEQGTLHFEATMPNMVFQDTTDKDYASLRITPTWFDSDLVLGESYIGIAIYLPEGVEPDEIRYQQEPFTSKVKFEGRTVAVWEWPDAFATEAHMVGVSFPKRVMSRVVKVTILDLVNRWLETNPTARVLLGVLSFALFTFLFFRFSGGTGCTVFGLLATGLVLLFVISPISVLLAIPVLVVLVIWNEVALRKRGKTYLPPIAQTEGGGIKRGLTAPEAAILLELPLNKVLTLVIFGMLQKGLIRLVKQDPLTVEVSPPFRTWDKPENRRSIKKRRAIRRKAAQQLGTVVHAYEDYFLDQLERHPKKPIKEIDFTQAMETLIERTARKMKGFDLSDTQDYYRRIITRAMQQAKTLGEVEMRKQYLDKYLPWVLMNDNYPTVLTYGGYHYWPSWIRSTGQGGKALAVGRSGGRSGGGGGKTSFGDVAASFAGWAENTMGGLASAVAPSAMNIPGVKGGFIDLSGVDRATGDVFEALAKSSGGSGGGGGGGGSSCACACAGCACACACAGGGR